MSRFFIALRNIQFGNMKITYEQTPQFKRDFKKLSKKFPTLAEDLEILKKSAIEIFHIHEIDNKAVFEIEGVGNREEIKFYKVKKFACRSLKGKGARSGLRLIYTYLPHEGKICLLEIYLKSSKSTEDKDRIKEFLK